VRAVLELAGIHDILSKSLGSQNPINLVKATVAGLQSLRTPEEVAELRGLSINKVLGLTAQTETANGTISADGEAAEAEAEAEAPAEGVAAVQDAPAEAQAPADATEDGAPA